MATNPLAAPKLARPKLEGTVEVADGRRLGFAEFGDPQGKPIFWLHGTPGARRQIPPEARVFAAENNIRLLGVDRPGIGSSTPHRYDRVLGFAQDLEIMADTMGIDKMTVVGLSGGGPYTLACAAAMPDRVLGVGVLGGVAPLVGSDGISGGAMTLGRYAAPVLEVVGAPVGALATNLVKVIRPVALPVLEIYARLSPEGDREMLARPEFKAMFLDDLLNGGRKQLTAPFSDIVVFARDWGFRLDEVKSPVKWWHGDKDHIIPYEHGLHVVQHLPDAEMVTLPGESHLGGLGYAREILGSMNDIWERESQR